MRLVANCYTAFTFYLYLYINILLELFSSAELWLKLKLLQLKTDSSLLVNEVHERTPERCVVEAAGSRCRRVVGRLLRHGGRRRRRRYWLGLFADERGRYDLELDLTAGRGRDEPGGVGDGRRGVGEGDAVGAEHVVADVQRAASATPRKASLALFTHTIRYDTRCYINVRSKANMSQLNLPHGNDN